MARLRILLLGSYQAICDETVLSFPYERVRAVLAYLAVNAGQTVTRDKLAGLIWPDQTQSTALENLRQALSRLRKSIGEFDQSAPILTANRDRVALFPNGDMDIDLVLFKQHLERAARHLHRHPRTCGTCATHRTQAAELYRGPFLEDLSLPDSDLFESWAAALRQQLHGQALENLDWLADYHQRLGNEDASLYFTRQQQALDPLSDELALNLVRRLAEMGKREQALTFYRGFKRQLENQLAQAPMPALVELADRLRAGEPISLDFHPSTDSDLPFPLMPIVGRQVELNELSTWLADPGRRLITILGLGGSGKSRLAQACARQHRNLFEDGVVFLNLTGCSRPEDLCRAVVRAAGVSGSLVTSTGITFPPELREALENRDQLWVLDGFEGVVEGKGLVSELLAAGPGLVVLVTSCTRLDLPGEWVFPLGGLPFPPQGWTGDLSQYDAVNLFITNAFQLDPSFQLSGDNQDAIEAICRMVDGLPLAIMLAAAWARSMPCAEIACELQRSLDLLGGSSPGGVRAALENSWKRLDEEERRVFRQLSIFQNGFDRNGAQVVSCATLSTLERLVDHSCLRASSTGRYEMLDLVRQFAAEKLVQAGEEETAHQRHFQFYYRAAAENDAELRRGGNDIFRSFFWLAREEANLRAAIDWAKAGSPPRFPQEASQLEEWMHEKLHGAGNQTGTLPML